MYFFYSIHGSVNKKRGRGFFPRPHDWQKCKFTPFECRLASRRRW
nr:MAG TPA: hypothetical protein [Caudoviricetes sp.]